MIRIKESGIHIGLAHGSLKQGNLDVDYDFPMSPEEIELSKLDYLALGHWHRPSTYKFGQTVAAYPGIPQQLTFNYPDSGRINIVKVGDKDGVTIDNTTTSSIVLKLIDDIIYHPYELEKVLDSQADPAKIIKLDLKYSDNFKEYSQIKRIIDQFRSRFLLVAEKENKITKTPAEPAATEESQPLPLIESYQIEIKKLRDEDSDERRELYDRARELGIKIIKGEI
jgi:DNA repair exonuclease SbcCD nuclease subunit